MQVAHLLANTGLACEVVVSKNAEGACEPARALPDDVAVVAVGGDGTIGALLPAVVGNGRYFGAISAGRGNDLAYALEGVWEIESGFFSPRDRATIL